MRWFGPKWQAPVCESTEEAIVPVGRPCARCERPLLATSQGMLVPRIEGGPEDPYHRLCLLELFGIKLTVHILDGGLPLCRFSTAVPGRWPHGHFWTRVEDHEDANCPECLALFECRT